MNGNDFNNNQFTDQSMNNNNMFNQNNFNNSNTNNIDYNSVDTRMCTNNNDSQNSNNFFGNNYNQYIDSNNNNLANNNNQNNNQNINENNQNQNPPIYFDSGDNILDETLSQVMDTKKFINDKHILKDTIPISNETKIIQRGQDFNDSEIEDIKNICISLFDSTHPYEQTNVEKISQRLKIKYDGEWFVLISEQSSQKQCLNFDFKFSNIESKDIFILSHLTHRFYIGKIKNINN